MSKWFIIILVLSFLPIWRSASRDENGHNFWVFLAGNLEAKKSVKHIGKEEAIERAMEAHRVTSGSV